jgi:hypothetical protein
MDRIHSPAGGQRGRGGTRSTGGGGDADKVTAHTREATYGSDFWKDQFKAAEMQVRLWAQKLSVCVSESVSECYVFGLLQCIYLLYVVSTHIPTARLLTPLPSLHIDGNSAQSDIRAADSAQGIPGPPVSTPR